MDRSTFYTLVIAGLWWPVSLPALAQSEALSSLVSYERTIAALQTQPADVSAQLGEAYSGLGNTLQSLQRHQEAMAAYGQALQLFRENGGLYTLEQLPLLESRLASSQALASWQEVDADRQLAYQVAVKNPAANVALHYQTLRELGLWKLRAADEKLLPNDLDVAREAEALYRRELDQPSLRADYQGKPLWLANLYLDLAAIEFLQAKKKLALPLDAYKDAGPRKITETYCETIPTPDGRGRQVCRNMQVPNLDYFMSLSDKKYAATWEHLDAMQDAVLEAYSVLLPEVDTTNRDDALLLLAEVRRLTDAFNDFVEQNARGRTGSRIAAPTGSRISH